MIRVEKIGVLRDEWIFRNVSFDLPQGQLVGIIGDSGAGKSTLLKAISGHLDIVEGKVFLDDKALIGPSDKLVPGYEEIQLVNQDFELDNFHTVAENIKEKVLHLPKKDQKLLVEEMLDLMELQPMSDRQARYLSGGEQQRVALARALVCEPRFLLLDEPFVHLDQRLRLKIMSYLKSLNEVRKTTIVLVSHDGAEVMGFVDTVIHFSSGGVQRIAPVSEIYYNPESLEQGLLMGMINRIDINGEKILFRPSEYAVEDGNISIRFQSFFDTGVVVFNYFTTDSNEQIVLASSKVLDTISKIRIDKHL